MRSRRGSTTVQKSGASTTRITKSSRPQRGFTLIELLVVIAIIGLISSIALATLSDARLKARNAQRLQIVDEYRKALELARTASGTYPITNSYRCLGNPASGICFFNRATHPSIIAALSPYMPTLPVAPAPGALPQYDGIEYFTCPGPSICGPSSGFAAGGYPPGTDINPDTYGMFWIMDTVTASCGPAQQISRGPTYTMCTYYHQ